ncbi:MAG TPA: hypothetical protein VEN99_05135 [Acidimicrobiia bacterium]|nr:hypothetical protein [Acidimicrobiia bacterium]
MRLIGTLGVVPVAVVLLAVVARLGRGADPRRAETMERNAPS